MRTLYFFLFSCLLSLNAFAQAVQDDFEGNGTITTWFGDDCGMDNEFSNPFQTGINTSNTVLEYSDAGGTFANVRFDVTENFDLSETHTFTLKVYVPSSGITGIQPNQVSLKLQDGTQGAPWATQSEIIKQITLDEWQELTFDFMNDSYVNLDPASLPPTQRTDFNRVLIQINGEDNSDQVVAYIDDVAWDGAFEPGPVFDNLIWSDEFDTDGPVDDTKWFHQTLLPNGDSWFNGEVQHYTDRTENSVVENGILKITAIKETFTDQGVTKEYTSARLNSKFTFQYGRVEVKAKLPFGVGTWPAIWTLGKNIDEDGGYWDLEGFGDTPWPACGEMDIMEHWGDNQNFVQSATHTPSSFGATINHGGQVLPTASDDFHVYYMEWTEDKLVFGVDDMPHFVYNPTVKDGDTWPFDAEQYFLLNVAIQAQIDPAFTSSAMEIDYIRVYQESEDGGNTAVAEQAPKSDWNIYPNPFIDSITLDVDEESANQPYTAKVLTLDGRVVTTQSGTINGTQMIVDNLNKLAAGAYLLEVQSGSFTESHQIVKK